MLMFQITAHHVTICTLLLLQQQSRLLLGTQAPVMTPDSVYSSFLSSLLNPAACVAQR